MSHPIGTSIPSQRTLLDPAEAVRRIVEQRASTGRLLLGLDFDGTLSPIVPVPEDAGILPEAERALRKLASRRDTILAIVTGRGLDDVRARVREERAFYAGNHGFEIEGPGLRHRIDAAERLRPELRMVSERLRHELDHVEGCEIEDKGITVSVHYRRVADADAIEVVRRVAYREAERSGLRVTEGKKIFELRPPMDWHKGRALEFLIETFAREQPIFPVFIGDDITDEDAFRTVQEHGGLAILVGDPEHDRESIADARVDSPALLVPLLDALADDVATGPLRG
jgi:trehalose-phosphatase